PYLPFIDMLRCYFEIQETESAASIKRKLLSKLSRWEYGLEETLPPLQEILSLAVEDSSYLNLETKRKRERSFEAIKRVFERQSSEKLLVLVAEDLHWIDNTSQDLLTYLLGELSGLRILILMLYRPEYSAPLSAESLFREMRLSHLTAESTKELVTSLLKDSSLSSELMEVIFTRTGGNPLFVEEFTRNLLDKGWIRREEDKWGLVPDSNGLRIPDTIRGVIGARMDRLKQASKLTMQLASVIGREFAISLLGALPGVPKELENNLAELQRFDFIFWLGSDPEDKCVFRHALTQEAAYSSLTAANRRRFHIDVGTAIEGLHKDRLEEVYEWLAYHYSKGEQWDQALKYLKLSTMKAISRNSPAEAFMSVKEALALLRARPPTKKTKRDELDILTMVQWAVRFLTHSLKEVDQYLKRGEELALELRDEESVSLFRAALCVYYSSRGETILSQEYLDDLLKEVQTQEREALTRDQLRLVVPLAFGSSWAGYISGRFSDILPINSKILKRMEEAEAFTESYETPFNAYAFLCAMSASASAWLGNFDNAVALAEKGLNVALGAQHFGSAGFVELHYGMAFAARGLGREALAHSTKSAEYYEIAKFGLAYLGPPWQITGYTYFLLDDLDSALRWITKGLQAQLDSGLHHYVALAYANLSTVHLALGNFQRAQSCVQEAMNWSETCGEPHLGALSKILAGTILAKSEHLQFAKAEALILEGIDTFKKLGMKPFYAQGFLHLGELFLNVGRNRAAIKYLKRAEKLFAEMEIGYWLSRTRKILESHQG
ncbi:MAG: hypothetical protein FJY85_01480, partial [Deltaproteobacteria bacterium]|nr:hypothetical protein [Deltaproteobacteria bacterium]